MKNLSYCYLYPPSFFDCLQEHGGSSNAFTAAEHTNYYFDVSPEALEPALDRFCQFFLSPLFTPSATSREVNAVNSGKLALDGCSERQLFSQMRSCISIRDSAVSVRQSVTHEYLRNGISGLNLNKTASKTRNFIVRKTNQRYNLEQKKRRIAFSQSQFSSNLKKHIR